MYRKELGIRLLSPGFCGGADQNQPEIRAASIRGHVRRWHSLLFGETDMKKVWGAVGKDGGASKIQLRVDLFSSSQRRDALLPHKDRQSGPRNALIAEFSVLLASRYSAELERAYESLRMWSLLGAIGTRANRAAGSVWPEKAPGNMDQLKSEIAKMRKLDVRVAKETGVVHELRKKASDTLSIPYLFGGANPRKPSPLKIKMVEFSDGIHLLLWTKQPGIIDSALVELKKRNKPLGHFNWIKLL